MKLKYIIPGMLALSCGLLSCQKNFLDRGPQTSISDAEYWKSPNDLKLYSNNFYSNILPSYGGFGTIGIYGLDADQGSDNQIIGDGYNGALNGQRTIPASGGGWSWGTLKNVNYLLANYPRVNASWDLVKPYVGEALYFRSLFYFDMLKSFGDLPWIDKPILDLEDETLTAPRVSRSVIADHIINDLDSAAAYMSTKSKAEAGRVYKELALALQSRVALFEGTWEKYHAGTAFGVSGSNGSKYLTKAADAANAVMSSNIFSLDEPTVAANNYWNVFNKTDYGSSKEIMFFRKYQIGIITHNWHRYTPYGAARGLTKNLVDYYLCTDGQPISVSPNYQGDATLRNIVANRDPRLRQTVWVPDANHVVTNNKPNGAAIDTFKVPQMDGGGTNSCPTGFQTYKGHNSDYYQQYAGDVGTTGLIFFRYAEVLLNYAEAKAELGTLAQADVDKSINLLRKRAGMPNMVLASITVDPNWEFPTLGATINEVRRERRVELACEGFRHDDIFRWAAADELILNWKPKGAKLAQFQGLIPASNYSKYPVDANGYIEPYQKLTVGPTGFQFNLKRDYLSPIPQDQMNLNTNFKQNPGWE